MKTNKPVLFKDIIEGGSLYNKDNKDKHFIFLPDLYNKDLNDRVPVYRIINERCDSFIEVKHNGSIFYVGDRNYEVDVFGNSSLILLNAEIVFLIMD